ncbi:MAG: leucine-rich repeat domain-containing protein [Prevotella sp.]|nr:leucine-rich repeat domain-containing protein [Prevotella sp.]
MTRIFTLLLLLASVCANAHDVEINGICYLLIDSQQAAVVSNKTPYSGFVDIPDSILYEGNLLAVTRIDDKAFCLCSEVSSVSLPATLEYIGVSAFAGCTSLSYINLPTSLLSIGDAAFSGCTQILSVTLPAHLTHIGTQAFAKCTNLNRFVVDEENTSFATQDGILMNHDLTHVVAFPPNHQQLASNTSSTITLPSSTRQIDSCAFAYCDKLTDITLPEGLLNIESAAFFQCTALAHVTLPNTLEEIGMYAFSECKSLTSIIIPRNTQHIGDGAFSFCDLLQNIFVSNGNSHFATLDGVLTTSDQRTLIALPGGRKGNYRIPASIDSIAPQAFYGCHLLESVTLPSHMADIGENPFIFCDELKEIHVDNANNAFQSLEGVLLNAEKTAIVAVPKAKQGIYAVPEGVTSIPSGPFLNNAGITALSLPTTLESIADYAFLGCYALSSVNLPQSLTSIGIQAFDDCDQLTQIICAGTPPASNLSPYIFNPSAFSNATLFVPKGSLTDYMAVTPWNQFENVSQYGIFADAQKMNRYAWQRLPIRLLPTLPITVLQAEVTLPEGFELAADNQQTPSLIPHPSSFNTYRLSMAKQEAFDGDTIFYVTMRSPRDGQTGVYNVSFNNIMLTYASPAGIGETEQKDFRAGVNLQTYRGDVNRNGRVNVADVVETIRYTQGKPTEQFHFEEADVNNNGNVNVNDAFQTIDIIQQEVLAFDINPIQWENAQQSIALSSPDIKAAMGAKASINIMLNNDTNNLTAHQFVLSLPQGIQLENNGSEYNYEKTARYTDNNQDIRIALTPSNVYSIISTSITAGTIFPGNGPLLTLNAIVDENLPEGNYEASLSRIIFADTDANELFLDDVRFNIFVTTTAGIDLPQTNNQHPTSSAIYNLQGQKMNSQLPPGIYIINGRKVVIK